MSVIVSITRNMPLAEATVEEKKVFARKSRRKSILEELAKDSNADVRVELLANPDLPSRIVIDFLIQDESSQVREAVKNYWDTKMNSNLSYYHLIKLFYPQETDFLKRDVQQTFMAMIYLLRKKYPQNPRYERKEALYFSIRDVKSQEVYCKSLEALLEDYQYIVKTMPKRLQEKMESFQFTSTKVYARAIDFKEWFQGVKRPEMMDEKTWLIYLAKIAFKVERAESIGWKINPSSFFEKPEEILAYQMLNNWKARMDPCIMCEE